MTARTRSSIGLTLAVSTLMIACTGPAASPAPATRSAPPPPTVASTPTAATATPTLAPTPTRPPATEAPTPAAVDDVPPTNVSTVLTGAYKLRVTSRDPFAAVQEQIVFEELPAVPGEASAWWYQWQGTYVALFVVPELTAEPLCPGTSFLAEGTQIYTFITNSPTDEGACDDYPFSAEQLVEPPFGARRCGSLIVYHTTIPVGQSGQVWSSIEQYSGDIVLGVTGRAETDGPPPELNPQAAAYDFGEGTELDGVLPPGESVVTC